MALPRLTTSGLMKPRQTTLSLLGEVRGGDTTELAVASRSSITVPFSVPLSRSTVALPTIILRNRI